ncbi:MAG TPA: BlaI/MecI/CopY family transcriptional regulator [Candidatus Acidoferrum sp.]|nr:BlaI/MecI/CopY family transcriptional regulator [Candidatus Acidoferrum sp.]
MPESVEWDPLESANLNESARLRIGNLEMIRFLKERILGHSESAAQPRLGRLENELMEILWLRGECNVREAVRQLERPLAYTTVMTTLDRLYKKGLLDRRMPERAFLYSARLTRQEWERQRAETLVAGFLGGSNPSRELLLSSFLDAVGEHDAGLLNELEKKIRRKRKEILRRDQS